MPTVSLLIRVRPWVPALIVGAVPLAVLPGAAAPFHTAKWTLMITLVPLGLAIAAVTGHLRFPLARLFLVWVGIGTLASLAGVAPWMSIAGSPNRNAGLVAMLVGVGAFVLGASTGDDPRVQRMVLRAAFISGGIVGLLGILEWSGVDLFSLGDLDVATRARSSWGSATFAAGHIVLVLPIAIAHIRSHDRRWKLVATISAFTMTVGLILTGTRGAWLGAAVAAGIMLPAWRRSGERESASDPTTGSEPNKLRSPKPKALAIAAVAAVSMIAAAALMAPSLKRASAVGRIDLWRTSATVIAEHPVIGAGLDTQRVVLPSGITPSFEAAHGSTELHDRAHNLVIDTTLTTGIVGLAAFGTLLLLLTGTIRQRLRRARVSSPALVPTAVAAGLIAYLVALMFAFGDPIIDPIAWLFAGLLLAALDNPLDNPYVEAQDSKPASGSSIRQTASATLPVLLALTGAAWGAGEIFGEYRLTNALDERATNHTASALESLQRGATLAPARFDLDQVSARLITDSLNRGELVPIPGSHTRLTGDQGVMRTEMIAYGLDRLERASAIAGPDPDVMTDKAELLTAAGRTADALETYEQVLKLYPNSFRAHLGRGLAAANSGDSTLAERSWLHSATLGPRDPRAWTNLGVLYAQQGDNESAVGAFERALGIDPDNAAAKQGLEHATSSNGD